MKPEFIKIQDALEADKDNFLIVKILSNKFAIVKHKLIDGGWTDRTYVMGLDKAGLREYGIPEKRAHERWLEQTQNIDRQLWAFDVNGKTVWRVITIDRRRSRRATRKLIKLL